MKIIALIPARSGSKELKDKNIRLYNGIPLLAHSIQLALQCTYISEVYVSTDSIAYQKIAIQYGANVTPLRPKEISDDLSPDIDVFFHFLSNYTAPFPNMMVHLRPTYPNRSITLLNNCIRTMIRYYDKYDSLRTVIPFSKTPYKMYFIKENQLIPFLQEHPHLQEPYNQARQHFPDTYLHNGCIDIVKTDIVFDRYQMSGDRIFPYIMNSNENNDIDTIIDFQQSEQKLKKI